jgi:hypothetical protein
MDIFWELRSMQIHQNHNFSVPQGLRFAKDLFNNRKTLRWNFNGLRIGVSIKFNRDYGFVWVLPSVDSLKYLRSIEQVVPKFFVAESMWSQQSLHKHMQCLSEAFLTEFSWYCTNSYRRLR